MFCFILCLCFLVSFHYILFFRFFSVCLFLQLNLYEKLAFNEHNTLHFITYKLDIYSGECAFWVCILRENNSFGQYFYLFERDFFACFVISLKFMKNISKVLFCFKF